MNCFVYIQIHVHWYSIHAFGHRTVTHKTLWSQAKWRWCFLSIFSRQGIYTL